MRRLGLLLGLLALLALGARTGATREAAPASVPAASQLAQAQEGTAPGYAGERPVEVERRIQQSRFRYLMLGYGLFWVSLGVYFFGLNRKITRVGREITELRDRLQEIEGPPRR